MLNGAIETLNIRVPAEKWIYVDVIVAPSTITIVEHEVGFEIPVKLHSSSGSSSSRTFGSREGFRTAGLLTNDFRLFY